MNETSSQHGSRLSTTFKRVHDRLDASRSDSRRADLDDRRRSVNVPAVLGLVALTAVTSWVVTRISVWLVPVYMSAMALIFAAPRTNRPRTAANSVEGPATEPAEGDEPTTVEGPNGSSSITAEPPADVSDAPGAAAPKPRKRRAKARRVGRGAEGDRSAAPVAWVRVGPGKFVRADVREPEAEGPAPTADVPYAHPTTDAGAESDATSEEVQPDPQPTEDVTTADPEATEALDSLESGSSKFPASAEVSETIAEEHDIASSTLGERDEFVRLVVSETIAEEHDIASSTLGERDETACLSEAVDLKGPQPVVFERSSPAAEPVVEAKVAAQAAATASAPTRSTSMTPDHGSIRPVVLLRPRSVEAPRLRPVGSVVDSGRLRDVRRGDAMQRLSTRTGRAADVRLRQRSDHVRNRLIRVERDFQPRSPPARS